PRIEMLEMLNEVSLEVSSPGIDRVIKNRDEYRIFMGRGVKIFLKDRDTPLVGVINEYVNDKNTLELKRGADTIKIDIDKIRKAKLYDYEEVEE
ncbi:MAG: ribosome maturation factor RimP, partial [Spirochaetes bacterium]